MKNFFRPHQPRLTRASRLARWDASFEGSRGIWHKISPPQLFVSSFLLLIAFGTLGLMVLPSLYTGQPLSLTDALFTATSAVCVTGLTVVDTATYFTPRGQAFILLLIQLGGLGILTFTSLILQVMGFRLSLRSQSLGHDSRQVNRLINLSRLTRAVVFFTFLIESAGAIALWILWAPRIGWSQAWWPAMFHSVSGFCNAGFSTNSDSLIGWQQSSMSLLVLSAVIIAGGIGFVVIEETWTTFSSRNSTRFTRISLNSQLILVVTALLIIVAWPCFAAFEWNGVLRDLPVGDKIANAFFLSVTPRTAGFNSINYELASDGTNFLTILLMSIGGAPGSTAGGMKVTTFALIVLLAWSRFRGQETTTFANRSISQDTTQRATGLAVFSVFLTAVGVFALLVTEQGDENHGMFLPRTFEVVSAINTVGLSMNQTTGLSQMGRWVVILLMFLGRVGPMTLAAAFVIGNVRRSNFRYAFEDVVVG